MTKVSYKCEICWLNRVLMVRDRREDEDIQHYSTFCGKEAKRDHIREKLLCDGKVRFSFETALKENEVPNVPLI